MGQIKNIKLHIVTDIKKMVIVDADEKPAAAATETITETTDLVTKTDVAVTSDEIEPTAIVMSDEAEATVSSDSDEAPSRLTSNEEESTVTSNETTEDVESPNSDKSCAEQLVKEDDSINWDVPCFAWIKDTPCWENFREAFSCTHYSTAEPPGSDCMEPMGAFMNCAREHPEYFPLDDDEDEEGEYEESIGVLEEEPV